MITTMLSIIFVETLVISKEKIREEKINMTRDKRVFDLDTHRIKITKMYMLCDKK